MILNLAFWARIENVAFKSGININIKDKNWYIIPI